MASAVQQASSSLSLSITNPLVLYRALLATHRIRPDPAQHRLALELQKIYYRLKDYNPEIEYRWRLEKAARLSRTTAKQGDEQRKAVLNDGSNARRFSISSIFGLDERTASMLALTRTIPVHDSAMEIDSPQGMLLYGEVGRGKSMLLDLLYSSLPTKKKRRWHFNTFILDIFRRLELARIERTRPPGLSLEHEHVLLSLARDTIETSPILFLDEFQMPDRVSGKLVHSFFTSFFSLGGVLVASSNRMPEELAKASGVEFAGMGMAGATARRGRGGQIWEKLNVGQKCARADFVMFVEILKQRCEIWEMEGERDWRREDGEMAAALDAEMKLEMDQEEAAAVLEGLEEASVTPTQSLKVQEKQESGSADTPVHYYLNDSPFPGLPSPAASADLRTQLSRLNPADHWEPSKLTVYARHLVLPMASPETGTVLLPFSQLCQANLGPADYISICSAFHTVVVTQIPTLTLSMKNEARRFITFLDACYEARCRLVIEAAAPPDRLFFPETRARRGASNMLNEGDSIESEAFSEMYQDSTAPFRPNISSYVGANRDDRGSVGYSGSTTSLYNKDLRSVLADEDADFGPTYGNRRSSSGVSSSAADYDDDGAALDERDRSPKGMAELELRQGPDFTQGASVFTGQDEQFAYKRARSRLWEMCGRRWWEERTNRHPSEWWTPVHGEGRFWESKKEAAEELVTKQGLAEGEGTILPDSSHDGRAGKVDAGKGRWGGKEKEDALFKHGASPYRTSDQPPPRFGWQHAWGMMTWGKKAGQWGKGVEGRRTKLEGEQDPGKQK
ncbi:hypothetical protein LTR70_007350 [Exophiala xenobiotica]|uniref:AAA+ ATPase domain-containing protein n=1 Tax=Lithohypha guttulata TaxID=1690604 RepID=A0ABR0K6E8_9EURO|nr:hypothetical protein LTR24_006921 [Lithohypha guttulata]KAK5313982.1 hypothetical protein LTR70_007350 [Exophiala xenobiotica]